MARPAGVWAFAEMFHKGMEKVWSNTFWFFAGAYLPPEGANPAEDFFVAWAAVARPVSPPSVIYAGCRVTLSDGAEHIGYEYYGGLAGTNATTTALPEDVSMVVQRISPHPGETGRGRIYVSGLSTAMASGSYVSSAGFTAGDNINTWQTATFHDSAGNAWAPSIYSHLNNALYSTQTSSIVALLATSRRRRSRF